MRSAVVKGVCVSVGAEEEGFILNMGCGCLVMVVLVTVVVPGLWCQLVCGVVLVDFFSERMLEAWELQRRSVVVSAPPKVNIS